MKLCIVRKSLAVNLFNPKAAQKTKLVRLKFQKRVCNCDFGPNIKLFGGVLNHYRSLKPRMGYKSIIVWVNNHKSISASELQLRLIILLRGERTFINGRFINLWNDSMVHNISPSNWPALLTIKQHEFEHETLDSLIIRFFNSEGWVRGQGQRTGFRPKHFVWVNLLSTNFGLAASNQ